MVLPDTSAAGAFQLATRICDVLREHRFQDAPNVHLTVSIGVVAASAEVKGTTLDVVNCLKSRADDALYAAKRGGRDRVRAWVSDDEMIVLGV